jgi:DNA-binding NtrC family response regulator
MTRREDAYQPGGRRTGSTADGRSPAVVLCIASAFQRGLVRAELDAAGFPTCSVESAKEARERCSGQTVLVLDARSFEGDESWQLWIAERDPLGLVVVSVPAPSPRLEALLERRRGVLVRQPFDLQTLKRCVGRLVRAPEPRRARKVRTGTRSPSEAHRA